MDKILKNHTFLLILILVIGILLRFWNLDKPEGLWNDEYLTWSIANLKFPIDFFEGIKSNCHAPLHYFYLKGWMALFHDNDYVLRLSSLIPGVIGIVVMYFTGREFPNKNAKQTGLACALLSAISSFLIYFSQEVRIYSMIFMLTCFILYFSIKIYNNPSHKNYWLLSLFSVLLILEHTIGFIFVFFNLFALLAFKNRKKKGANKFILPLISGLILILPLIPFLYTLFVNPKYFSQWWMPFSWSQTCFFFTDLFSPVLKNITNAPYSFYSQIISDNSIHIGFVIFALIPTGICLFLIIKSIIGVKKPVYYLLSVFIAVFATVLIASLLGRIVFLTKYMTELYPLLILMCAVGWAELKSKSSKIILATIFIFLSLFFILISHTSAIRLTRQEGQRIPITSLEKLGLKKNDKILFLYYPKSRFEKYITDVEAYKFSYSIDKYNFPYVIKDKNSDTHQAFKTGKKDYRKIFFVSKNELLDTYLENNIYSQLKKNERYYIVDLSSVSFLSPSTFDQVIRYNYETFPFLFLIFSYTKNYCLKSATEKLAYKGVYNSGNWSIFIFEKAI